MHSPSSIPENIAAVDTAFLSNAVKAAVTSFTITQIGQGVGIMGDIYRVHLTYQGADPGPSSVVVKLPSSFEENRAQGVALGMFEAEVRFYNELAPKLGQGIPSVFVAAIQPGTAEFVIVMEDLIHHTMVGQEAGMTFAQAQAAVEVLANIHAVWWNDVQNPALDWIPAMTGPRIEFVDQTLPGVFPAFAEGFSQYLSSQSLQLLETFVGNYMKVNQVLAGRSPWTLVHQDFRIENLMFAPDDSVTVLDWQGIGRGPGAYDLAYLLGGSMTESLRRQHEVELVAHYHDALCRAGIEAYALAQCHEDYSLAHLMGGLATPILLGGAMDLSNERGVNLVATMAKRHAQAALDHQGLAKLQAILRG